MSSSNGSDTTSIIEAQIYLEEPEAKGGVVLLDKGQPVRLNLWAIANDDIDHLDVHLDEEFVGRASESGRRADVAAVYPGCQNAEFRMFIPAELFLAEPRRIIVALHTKSGVVAVNEVKIVYRTRPLVPPISETSSVSDALAWDQEIWRTAFYMHVFEGDPVTRLNELEDQFRQAGDDVQADRMEKIRTAREILVAAWCGVALDPMLTGRLQDLSYLSVS